MRRSRVLFSSIFCSPAKLLPLAGQRGRDIPDRRSRLFFDLHRNRDHPVSAPGVLGGLLHHVAVTRALSHEVAAGYQIGAPELSRHATNPPSNSSRSSRMWPRASEGSRRVLVGLGPPGAQAALTSIVLGIAARGARRGDPHLTLIRPA